MQSQPGAGRSRVPTEAGGWYEAGQRAQQAPRIHTTCPLSPPLQGVGSPWTKTISLPLQGLTFFLNIHRIFEKPDHASILMFNWRRLRRHVQQACHVQLTQTGQCGPRHLLLGVHWATGKSQPGFRSRPNLVMPSDCKSTQLELTTQG